MTNTTFDSRFSCRIANLEASPIRDMLSIIERPGMISFAGGLPAPETFPEINLRGMPTSALQYGASEGVAGWSRACNADREAAILLDSQYAIQVLRYKEWCYTRLAKSQAPPLYCYHGRGIGKQA